MKLFTNLPGSLRVLFGWGRFLVVILAAFWFLTLLFSPWIQRRFTDDPKLIVSVGEVSFKTAPDAIGLKPDQAKPGSLNVVGLRGTLQADLLSDDSALVSALRATMIPAMLAFVTFSWLLFGSLRTVCGNIERGEVFSENNLSLVRNIGWILIGYSLASFGLELWGAHVMDGYFSQHVTVTGLKTDLKFPGGMGALHFNVMSGQLSFPGGLVTGLLVLMLTEAFRQGLTLKSENDLTV